MVPACLWHPTCNSELQHASMDEGRESDTDMATARRKHKRIKMVLPIRVWAKDTSNHAFNELAHTLDITPQGARIGAIHYQLKLGDKLTVQYRQRKIQFRVVWVRPLEGTKEYQVGVEATEGGETWGLELTGCDEADSNQATVTVQ